MRFAVNAVLLAISIPCKMPIKCDSTNVDHLLCKPKVLRHFAWSNVALDFFAIFQEIKFINDEDKWTVEWTYTNIYVYSMQQCNQMNYYYDRRSSCISKFSSFFLFFFLLIATEESIKHFWLHHHRTAQSHCSSTKIFFLSGTDDARDYLRLWSVRVSGYAKNDSLCTKTNHATERQSPLPPQTKRNANTMKRFTLFLPAEWW